MEGRAQGQADMDIGSPELSPMAYRVAGIRK